MPGKSPGPSILNPDTYEALKREGYTKSQAAAISNAALAKGHKKGKHNPTHAKRKRKPYAG
jgi:hypothetical protein